MILLGEPFPSNNKTDSSGQSLKTTDALENHY
jgi:hypothetical protein